MKFKETKETNKSLLNSKKGWPQVHLLRAQSIMMCLHTLEPLLPLFKGCMFPGSVDLETREGFLYPDPIKVVTWSHMPPMIIVCMRQRQNVLVSQRVALRTQIANQEFEDNVLKVREVGHTPIALKRDGDRICIGFLWKAKARISWKAPFHRLGSGCTRSPTCLFHVGGRGILGIGFCGGFKSIFFHLGDRSGPDQFVHDESDENQTSTTDNVHATHHLTNCVIIQKIAKQDIGISKKCSDRHPVSSWSPWIPWEDFLRYVGISSNDPTWQLKIGIQSLSGARWVITLGTDLSSENA